MEAYYRSEHSRLLILLLSISIHSTILILIFIMQVTEVTFDPNALRSEVHDGAVLSQSPTQGPAIIFEDAPEQPIQEKLAHAVAQHQATNTLAEAMDQHEELEEKAPQEDEQPAPHQLPLPEERPLAPMYEQLPIPEKKPLKRKRAYNGGRYYNRHERQKAAAALGHITQGFIKSVEQERGHLPKVQDDIDHISRQMYATKLWGMVRQTVNAHQKLIHLNHNVNEDAVIIITINKAGHLINFTLDHPDKTPELCEIEQLLSNAAHKAGLYPPIPSRFKTDVITFKFPLRIKGEHGFHTYEISYGA